MRSCNPADHLILIVDDSPVFGEFLQAVLRSHGYQAELALDAPAALLRLAAGDVALVVADLTMPGMSGLELLERIKRQPATQHLPVVVLTAWDLPGVKPRALLLGCAEFLVKPVANTTIVGIIERLLTAGTAPTTLGPTPWPDPANE